MSIEADRVRAYADTVARLEPEITMIDAGAAYASIAISLKRIADAQEKLVAVLEAMNKAEGLSQAIQFAITEGANAAIYAWRNR